MELVTRSGNHRIRKVNDLEYRIDANPERGMKVPVTIYANDSLISKMVTDRTIDQAANVATLPGVKKHVVVLPDGHEGYGFPVGGVAATDLETGVIIPAAWFMTKLRRSAGGRTDGKRVSGPRLKVSQRAFQSSPSGRCSEGAVMLTI